MNMQFNWFNASALMLILMIISGCTVREAATVAAVPGRTIGTAIGMTAVVVDESFKSAEDIVNANPRYDNQKAAISCCDYQPSAGVPDRQIHYYRTEVLVETTGPAKINSVRMIDSKEVKDFWY